MDNVAHDLHEVGRHRDVVDMIGPVRWKIRDADVHYRYAMSLSELDPEAGVTAWRAVLAIDPTHQATTHNLANQLVWMGRLEEAYPAVVAALALTPDEPWMLRCLAVIWQARGDAQQTEHWVRQFMQAAMAVVVDNDSDDEVDPADRYTLACAQMWVGLPEVALETLAEAVAAGASGVTPHLDVEWDPLRTDPRWQRLFPAA
jgi:thioredoxin-like negative regulator of GroEL